MSTDNIAEEIGNWKKERILGAGGFGYVVLWRNKETNETIALKQCRWGHDPMMTPKNRSRWKLEVDMMSRLNHPNVVTASAVPPELDAPATEMPLLAMEYCSNGDLRKLLNKPENCCGLKEKHVRLIMKHVSSAVNYLHSMRIIHRDLKPENIVIQDQNGKVVYKLIDLGYAKELDQGSLCTSFVGTLQYLAPELFMSQKYSCTVDYWSLGLLTHEVITGSRPFLPDKSPAEWIPIIKRKSSTEIRAYLDEDKNIVFSDEISPFHHISSTFKSEVELWLQLLLEWDPKKRGRYNNASAFNLLETILSKKIAHVFCVDSFRLLTFQVNEEMSFEDFGKELEAQTKIPIHQQEIILPDGHIPDSDKGVDQFISNLEEEEKVVFLFDKNPSLLSPLSSTVIPPTVENVMRNPHKEVEYQAQVSTWAQAVHLNQQECTLINRIVQAFKANLINLVTKNSYTHKSVSRMAAEMNKLLAKCSFFKNSLEQDINSYENQAQSGGFTSETLKNDWKNTFENLKKVDLLRQKVINLEACLSSINANTVDLQKTPFARSKWNSSLEDIHHKILEGYGELRRRPSEQRRIPHNNTVIVRLLCLALQKSHAQTQEIVTLIRKEKQIRQDIDDFLPQIMNILDEISVWDSQIEVWQAKRQRALWKVIDTLNDRAHQLERSVSPLMLSNSPQASLNRKFANNLGVSSLSRASPDSALRHTQESPRPSNILKISPPIIIPSSWQNQFENLSLRSLSSSEDSSVSTAKLNSSISNGMKLSTVLDETTKESRHIKKENETVVESFQTMMEVLKSFTDSGNCETLKQDDTSSKEQ